MGRLEGKVTVVTGAGSGIGYACAHRFAEEGAAVVGCDLTESTDWDRVASAAKGSQFHIVDVRDEAAQAEVAVKTLEEFGRIDVLVTAAGVAGGGPVHLLSLEDWQRVQDVNLTGTFLSAKAVLPAMIEQRSGSIITIASVEGLEGGEGASTAMRADAMLEAGYLEGHKVWKQILRAIEGLQRKAPKSGEVVH